MTKAMTVTFILNIQWVGCTDDHMPLRQFRVPVAIPSYVNCSIVTTTGSQLAPKMLIELQTLHLYLLDVT